MDPATVSAAAVASNRPREAPEAAPAPWRAGGSYIEGGITKWPHRARVVRGGSGAPRARRREVHAGGVPRGGGWRRLGAGASTGREGQCGSARTEVRVAMAAWLTAGAPSVGASLHVTAVGQPRKDGTCRSEVKLSLGVMRGPAEVKTQVRVAGARAQQGTGVRLRLSSTQIRREGVGEYEDPRSGVRGHWGSQGAGRTCARARRAETVAERLRREGARVHEDTRFEVGAARPLADLRHVLGECPGECPGRGGWRGW